MEALFSASTPWLRRRWSADIVVETLEGGRAAFAKLHELSRTQDHPLGDRPLVVLTRGMNSSQQLRDVHAGLARLSTNSRHTAVAGAGHEIHLFEPPAVIQAIRDVVVAQLRSGPGYSPIGVAPERVGHLLVMDTNLHAVPSRLPNLSTSTRRGEFQLLPRARRDKNTDAHNKGEVMVMKRLVLCVMAFGALWLTIRWAAYGQQGEAAAAVRIYNTAKLKLKEGKQIVGGTVSSSNPEIYYAMANAGFDFLWIEMQHSPLTHQEVARMIWAGKGAPAIPFVRVPDATESDIQKATDNGALGIIIPMVETVEKVKSAVKFAKYPPMGKRSQGGGQYGALWGSDYRRTANDNIMVVAMIESPAGVAIAEEVAAVPGVDVVFVASTDLGSFSGYRQGDPQYEALVTKVHDATLKVGLKLGGPLAWKNRPGYSFFQGPGETSLIRSGAQVALGMISPPGTRPGVAPTEGEEPRRPVTPRKP